ncbi:MAG: beta-N-acetylhexosaminidase [Alphaproteobacteria bacterium]|nr:beta-N-acetylhexosaminidase [Alphaproteobacteria bacterium]
MISAAVYGIAGAVLTQDERAFFRDADPLGFILFARNCANAGSIQRLTGDLRDLLGREDVPVLIDQEGGRVMRLRPPDWPDAPPARTIANFYERNQEIGREIAETLGRMFGAMLIEVGIDVDCAPVLDLGFPNTTDAIGNRAYSAHPEIVTHLGQAMARGLMREGCLPVIKHMPGHGRCTVDSHKHLPRVDADLLTLRTHDFVPFRAARDLPLGMSAHVVYSAIDPERAGTVSGSVINELIRGEIGFDGFLLTDDIAMDALSGSPGESAAAALTAGCDAVLHCSGNLTEMVDVAGAVSTLTELARRRWDRAQAARQNPEGVCYRVLSDTLNALLNKV